MGQLKWVWSQTTKMTQIKDNKSSPIKQQEDWYERGTYISKQVKMHAYHLNFETFKNAFCKFHKRNPWWDPSKGKPPWNGQIENDLEKFLTFEKFVTWASRPWELGHLKNLYIFQFGKSPIIMRLFKFWLGQATHEN